MWKTTIRVESGVYVERVKGEREVEGMWKGKVTYREVENILDGSCEYGPQPEGKEEARGRKETQKKKTPKRINREGKNTSGRGKEGMTTRKVEVGVEEMS